MVGWFFRPLSFGGVAVAVAFFALAMTPSLVPRSWSVQGVLAGLTAWIGYGIGSTGWRILRGRDRSGRSRRPGRTAWLTLMVMTVVLVSLAVGAGAQWDEELRHAMDMDVEEPWHDAGTILVALLVATILLFVARAVRGLGRLCALAIGRVLPRRASMALGGLTAAVLLVFVSLGWVGDALFRSIDASSELYDRTIRDDIAQPQDPMRSGSPESLIEWEDLGNKGRQFTGTGPSVEEIEAFSGGGALPPIRLYGGLNTGSSVDERVEVLVQELDRTEAWNRSAIIVQTPSGNGDVPRVNASAPEYILNGDVAQVALQYSYAPSFTTMVTKPGAGEEAAQRLLAAVTERVDDMPVGDRPEVYVAGESLGSLATESAFSDVDDLATEVDGALFVGPTLFNDIRNELTDGRDPGSPVWLPVVDDGSVARFAVEPADLGDPDGDWDGPRVVYLQNTSDPVAWFSPRLLWEPPEFLDDPRGPDVSSDMRWVPVVTFWQVLIDLPFASGTPAGHGHRYGLNVADGWVAVLDPPGWEPGRTAELREALAAG